MKTNNNKEEPLPSYEEFRDSYDERALAEADIIMAALLTDHKIDKVRCVYILGGLVIAIAALISRTAPRDMQDSLVEDLTKEIRRNLKVFNEED